MPISEKELSSLNPPEKVKEKALKEFGLTNDFREAGYILKNGKLLDFSGKLQGGTPFSRNLDHRDIWQALDTGSGISGTDAMLFFEKQGNIRFGMYGRLPHTPEVSISLNTFQEPTEEQVSSLRKAVNYCKIQGQGLCDIAYDVYYKNGSRCIDGYLETASSHDLEKVSEALRVCKIKEKKIFETP